MASVGVGIRHKVWARQGKGGRECCGSKNCKEKFNEVNEWVGCHAGNQVVF